MPHLTHVTVTAPEGRRTPIHESDGKAGTEQLQVVPGIVDRVRWSRLTSRAVGRGDLILCDLNGAPVASVELADAPDELPGLRVEVGSRCRWEGGKLHHTPAPGKALDKTGGVA